MSSSKNPGSPQVSARPNQLHSYPDHGYWNDVSQEFENRPFHLDPFLGALKRDSYLGLVERWAPQQATGTVLKTDLFEEAFGPDALVPELARRARLIVAFDVSSRIAHLANTKLASENHQFTVADVRQLPFASSLFDLIVSPSTLDHFQDSGALGASLRELSRVLKPDGRLIVSVDNRQNIGDPVLRLAKRLGWIPFYLGRSYTVSELGQELEAAGFQVSETTAILHNPRLAAVASVAMARRLGWKPLQRLIHRLLLAAQSLERTRLRYYTGSFVAALATKPAE